MRKFVDTARVWWREISNNERTLLIVALGMTFATIIYLGLWSPANKYIEFLRSAAPEARMQLAWMKNQQGLVSSIKRRNTASPATNILSTIESTISAFGLNEQISQLEPVEPGKARVKLKDANFNLVTKWISTLNRQHGISVKQAIFDKSNTAGRVNVQMVLRSGD